MTQYRAQNNLLLIATVALEIVRHERMFALAALIASIGFAATLPILNVDAFIVRQNVQRAVGGQKLDISYFTQLSADALPALVNAYHSNTLPASVKDALGASLVCIRQSLADRSANSDWRSFNLSRWNETNLLSALETELQGYKVDTKNWPSTATSPSGEKFNCGPVYGN